MRVLAKPVSARGPARVLVVDRSNLEAACLAEFLCEAGLNSSQASLEDFEAQVAAAPVDVVVIAAEVLDANVAARVNALAVERVVVLGDVAGKQAVDIRGSVVVNRRHQPQELIAVIHGADATELRPDKPVRNDHIDDDLAARFAQLTEREMEVLRVLLRGAATQELAEELGISANTMRTHVQNILGKLGVHSRLGAVALALRAGLRNDNTPGALADV